MPTDFQSNSYNPKVSVFFSINAELISAIHLLANPTHHEFAAQWTSLMMQSLSVESKELLKIISYLPTCGMQFFELLQASGGFHDVEALISQINEYDEIRFLEVVFEVERDIVIEVLKDKQKLLQLIEERPWIESENLPGIEYIFYNTLSFMKDFVQLIKETYNQHFIGKIKSLEEAYADSIANINKQLEMKKPLQLCQEIMGKTFQRVFDFKEFILIPSYFISPHRLRTFDKERQILIYDLRRDNLYLNQVGVDITAALKVLSDRTRMEILRQLLIGPTYGKVLASRLDLTTATISHHLEQLRSVNLVEEEKVKNTKYFKGNKEELEKLMQLINDYMFNKM